MTTLLPPARAECHTAWGNWQAIRCLLDHSHGCRLPAKPGLSALRLGGKFSPSNFNSCHHTGEQVFPKPNSGTYGYLFTRWTFIDNQYIERIDFSPNPQPDHRAGHLRQVANVQGLPFTGATLPGFGDVSTHIIQQYTGD